MTTENQTPTGTPSAGGTPADPGVKQPITPTGEGLTIEPEVISVPSTGDPALDIAVKFFTKSGIPHDSEAMARARDGDFTLLRAQIAEKGVKGGDQYVSVMESVHARTAETAKALKAAAEATVQSMVGGAENWAKIKEYAAQNGTAEELAAINSQLRAGGVQARSAALYLQQVYERGTGVKIGAGPAPMANFSNQPSPGAGGALSPREYREAVRALAAKVGAGRIDNDPEFLQLRQRRAAWKG